VPVASPQETVKNLWWRGFLHFSTTKKRNLAQGETAGETSDFSTENSKNPLSERLGAFLSSPARGENTQQEKP
jgi:hypothetical protein